MQQRIEQLQQQLADRNVDSFALIPGANMKYMTSVDFHLMERPVIGLFFPEEQPLFITPDFEIDRLSAMPVRAATYSDGLVQGSASLSDPVMKILKKTEKPYLEYEGDAEYVEKFSVFYDSIIHN